MGVKEIWESYANDASNYFHTVLNSGKDNELKQFYNLLKDISQELGYPNFKEYGITETELLNMAIGTKSFEKAKRAVETLRPYASNEVREVFDVYIYGGDSVGFNPYAYNISWGIKVASEVGKEVPEKRDLQSKSVLSDFLISSEGNINIDLNANNLPKYNATEKEKRYQESIKYFESGDWQKPALGLGYKDVRDMVHCLLEALFNNNLDEYIDLRIKKHMKWLNGSNLEEVKRWIKLQLRLSIMDEEEGLSTRNIMLLKDLDEYEAELYNKEVKKYNERLEELHKGINKVKSKAKQAPKVEQVEEAFKAKNKAYTKWEKAKTLKSSENECWSSDSPHFREWCIKQYYSRYEEAKKKYREIYKELEDPKYESVLEKSLELLKERQKLREIEQEINTKASSLAKSRENLENGIKFLKKSAEEEQEAREIIKTRAKELIEAAKEVMKNEAEEKLKKAENLKKNEEESIDSTLTRLQGFKGIEELDEEVRKDLEQVTITLQEALKTEEVKKLNEKRSDDFEERADTSSESSKLDEAALEEGQIELTHNDL